jgi:hypothetical protein
VAFGILCKVAAPWGRVGLDIAASGYSDSGNALAAEACFFSEVTIFGGLKPAKNEK